MKIYLDQTLNRIEDDETGDTLLHLGMGYAESLKYQKILDKVLTESQLLDSGERDSSYKLSKKRERILFEEIAKLNSEK